MAYDMSVAILTRLAGSLGVRAVDKDQDDVAGSAFVFIAVAAMAVLLVLREVASELREDHLVVSLAAAVPIARMEEAIGKRLW